MCESCLPRDAHLGANEFDVPDAADMTRRRFLAHSAVVAFGASNLTGAAAAVRGRQSEVRTVDIGGGVTILGRDAWGADRPPTAAMSAERPEDVKFLLVHHTVSSNTYRSDDVAGMIRGFHSFHTGSEKRWADVAYNFLIDRFGRVWEARAGSIDQPMKGSATGGSQGHALLCSFIGDHMSEAPSAEAQNAMVHLLAWLADSYAISTAPGATTSFVSRGSNRHPEGTTVETPTIQGHRGMSLTSCPGDVCFALVEDDFPVRVEEIRAARPAATTTTTTIAATTAPTTTTTNEVSTTTSAETTSTTAPTTESVPTTVESIPTSETTATSAPTSTSTATSAELSETTTTNTPTTVAAGDSATTTTSLASPSTSGASTTVGPGSDEVAIRLEGDTPGGGRGLGTLGVAGGTIVALGAISGGVIARRRRLATEAIVEPPPIPR